MNKIQKKKRFSDEQIRYLEVRFGSESKPDPRMKQQLAAELGLQPRQVAIWFQNRRARFKPKQIERDYVNLKASYDDLACKFASLKRENHSLNTQLRTLIEKSERIRMERIGRVSHSSESSEHACLQPEKQKVVDNSWSSEYSCFLDQSSCGSSQWWEFW